MDVLKLHDEAAPSGHKYIFEEKRHPGLTQERDLFSAYAF